MGREETTYLHGLQDTLLLMGACGEAALWAGGKTLREAWEQCHRADWMIYLLQDVGLHKQAAELCYEITRRAMSECAEKNYLSITEMQGVVWGLMVASDVLAGGGQDDLADVQDKMQAARDARSVNAEDTEAYLAMWASLNMLEAVEYLAELLDPEYGGNRLLCASEALVAAGTVFAPATVTCTATADQRMEAHRRYDNTLQVWADLVRAKVDFATLDEAFDAAKVRRGVR